MSEQLNLSKNDTLSTVLMVAVVFFVFYYLCKPKSSRECFAVCPSKYDPVWCCDTKKYILNECKAKTSGCKSYRKYRNHKC